MPPVRVRPLRRADVAIVRRLVQLYLYDLGGERWGVEPDGTLGGLVWHRRFWIRRGAHHFIILVGTRPAGFAGDGVREISEFFVLRKYRRRGVGRFAARTLFARFPGPWEVAELTWNVGARRFWRDAIRRCAVGRVRERRRRHGDLAFDVQHFKTTNARRPAPLSLRRHHDSL